MGRVLAPKTLDPSIRLHPLLGRNSVNTTKRISEHLDVVQESGAGGIFSTSDIGMQGNLSSGEIEHPVLVFEFCGLKY